MSNLYNLLLFLHSWNRWIILILGIVLIVRLISALSGSKEFSVSLKKLALYYIISLHIQLLFGLLLYFFLSPLTSVALDDFAFAMKNPGLRFWAVEHTFLNIIGIALAQIGYARSKRQINDYKRLKTMLTWTSISLILIILVIPIGIMGVDRPLFRF
ncbi:MAG TPA: hypothetical protein VK172_15625 [Lentimicrobium sp.]|nr:hypothetical protein [Lentimicrobium sp.]